MRYREKSLSLGKRSFLVEGRPHDLFGLYHSFILPWSEGRIWMDGVCVCCVRMAMNSADLQTEY